MKAVAARYGLASSGDAASCFLCRGTFNVRSRVGIYETGIDCIGDDFGRYSVCAVDAVEPRTLMF